MEEESFYRLSDHLLLERSLVHAYGLAPHPSCHRGPTSLLSSQHRDTARQRCYPGIRTFTPHLHLILPQVLSSLGPQLPNSFQPFLPESNHPLSVLYLPLSPSPNYSLPSILASCLCVLVDGWNSQVGRRAQYSGGRPQRRCEGGLGAHLVKQWGWSSTSEDI